MTFLEVLECCYYFLSVCCYPYHARNFFYNLISQSFVLFMSLMKILYHDRKLMVISIAGIVCLSAAMFVHFLLLTHYFLILNLWEYGSYCVFVVGLWLHIRFCINRHLYSNPFSDPCRTKITGLISPLDSLWSCFLPSSLTLEPIDSFWHY